MIDIPLSAIDCPDPLNGRLELDPEHVRSLAGNIAATCLMNPITVRANGDRYELIAGNSRLAAVRQLGWLVIAATVVDVPDLAADTMRLAENVRRAAISPIAEAVQLGKLVEAHPAAVDGVAQTLGVKVQWILDRLELLQYPDALIGHIHAKRISLAAAARLVRIEPQDLRETRIEQAAHFTINAKTAALWLQDSMANLDPGAPLPDFSTDSPIPKVETTISVNCFTCKLSKEFKDTVAIRLCSECLQTLSGMANTPDRAVPPAVIPDEPTIAITTIPGHSDGP